MGRFWITASGSGGTGKSSVSVGLAMTASGRGIKTLLLDAAGPYRTCDLYLGIQGTITIDLTDVLLNRLDTHTALYDVPGFAGFSYACTSLFSIVRLDEFSTLLLLLQGLFDLIIIDLPTGGLTLNPSFLKPEDQLILLTRPDPIACRACEMLSGQFRSIPAGISPIINFDDGRLRRKHLQYSQDAVSQLLDLPILGVIPKDPDFFTLHADGERIPGMSGRERRLFETLCSALLA